MTDAPDLVTVVTSCTSVKASAPGPLPAEDLYRGQQHVRLMRGVRRLRDTGTEVDLRVVSAGYGLLRGSEPIQGYDRTFSGLRASERHEAARGLGIPAAVRQAVAAPSDLAVVLLGDHYLDACELADNLIATGPTLLFCSAAAALRFPAVADVRVVALRTEHTRTFACGFVGLKGEIGGRLLAYIADGAAVHGVLNDADLLTTLAAFGPVTEQPAISERMLY